MVGPGPGGGANAARQFTGGTPERADRRVPEARLIRTAVIDFSVVPNGTGTVRVLITRR